MWHLFSHLLVADVSQCLTTCRHDISGLCYPTLGAHNYAKDISHMNKVLGREEMVGTSKVLLTKHKLLLNENIVTSEMGRAVPTY